MSDFDAISGLPMLNAQVAADQLNRLAAGVIAHYLATAQTFGLDRGYALISLGILLEMEILDGPGELHTPFHDSIMQVRKAKQKDLQ